MRRLKEVTLIFPHQLFSDNPAVSGNRKIYLIEHPRFFTAFNFHKKKLVLHRASMQAYKKRLEQQGYIVKYIPYNKIDSLWKEIIETTIHYIDPVDIPLQEEITKKSKEINVTLLKYESPSFVTSITLLTEKLGKKKKYSLRPFYIWQRKRLNILITKNGKPIGGAWNFDKKNREPFPAQKSVPKLYKPRRNKFEREAIKYVEKHFAKNPGSCENFFYPTTDAIAKKWFDDFLKNRLKNFGTYQDAIVKDEHFLFHSVLTPALNIGLLTPMYVLKKTISYAKKHRIPLNSLEGFIRQIIGWREFVRGVYHVTNGAQKKKNFFKHTKKMPQSFWYASTGIKPIDTTIENILDNAYAHHIERLMILGNFMLLCGIKPNDVYTWFMELFIDAYDWVMIPNVYGMSQYADGGLMTTKPYISSANYIINMSNYKKSEWADIWTALYWSFIKKNKDKFLSIGRLKIMATYINKLKKSTIKKHAEIATQFLKKLH